LVQVRCWTPESQLTLQGDQSLQTFKNKSEYLKLVIVC
jgi:hypothetical protein